MIPWEILTWDSNFFGFPVGRLVKSRMSATELHDILEHLREQSVRLVYWSSEYGDDESKKAARSCKGFLVDRKTTYCIKLKHHIASGKHRHVPGVLVMPHQDWMPTGVLEDLAVQSGRYSRYAVDPHVPTSKFRELYLTWIRESLAKTIADEVFVAVEEDTVLGVVTVGRKGGRGDIGLLAVAEQARGRGIGNLLVDAATDWFRVHTFEEAQVVTQGDNTSACRLYEKCGYSVEQVVNFYHLWLD